MAKPTAAGGCTPADDTACRRTGVERGSGRYTDRSAPTRPTMGLFNLGKKDAYGKQRRIEHRG
ncbi:MULTISPECIES: hypothetical protein, partial [unclassified Halorhodospira]|uniref:hypothetical protein n=1 Tax=unclassified Halorhodospira TaxID=2626748 RepID=UPI001EE79A38